MSTGFLVFLTCAVFVCPAVSLLGQESHPNLFISTHDVTLMKEAVGKYPLFDKSLDEARKRMDRAFASALDVPVPKDAGGYTHERHKQNYTEMQLAGVLYAVTGEERYVRFVSDMLLKYADLYPTLGRHPAAVGEAAGRLFWQTLNETVWLVYATQAYDCIYDQLSVKDRATIENGVFRPMAKFLSEDRVHEMDRIHNHGTWSCAAVGMAGYVLHDRDLVEKALYGSKKDRTGGFLRQIELLFSPDGLYTEGAYYVRYALLPFFTFAEVIEHNDPDLKIFAFRDSVLKKAMYSALQLTYTNGAFIPINDALKEKSYLSPEIIVAVDITYERYGNDRSLLPIARRHNAVLLSGAGVAVARALAEKDEVGEFPYRSVEFRDGAKGDEGGLGILRSGSFDDQMLVLMKYTGHGLSHGHFDKLEMICYDQGRELLQDYGSARFVNVETKYGGRYLPENKTFAMQTIAHNTATVDQQSQYRGEISVSERFHPDRHFFSASDPNYQVMSATCDNAYPGVIMQRTIALAIIPELPKPLILDAFRIVSDKSHTYDLPFYYMGHLMQTNVQYAAFGTQQNALGTSNGYQHLWKEAEGKAPGTVQVTWLSGRRYYTLSSAGDDQTKAVFVRIGASDPNFDLRHEPGVVLRRTAASTVFASVLEPHGDWDGINEYSSNAKPSVTDVTVVSSTGQETVIEIRRGKDSRWLWFISNEEANDTRVHSAMVEGVKYEWSGNSHLTTIKDGK